ncbi:MAG: carboxypeptidase regulatory-like domain-containing protein [Bryobacterales bacterium]|nr:carboxypeptidase regulatory-like domain-containing protein [Bryobacterales bacterium]
MVWKRFILAAALSGGAACAAVIQGHVIEKQTGRPLARARVALLPLRAEGRGPAPVFTNSAGYFAFPNAPAGAVVLTAERRGYAAATYGQKRWNGPGTPIVLERDGVFTAELRLSRLGALSGAVVDENGVGVEAVQVSAYKDGRPLRLAGHATSDDRGVFRISGLEPGTYRVRTGAKQLADETGLLPTFFGDSPGSAGSTPVTVNLDDEATGLLIQPAPGKLLRLSGRVNAAGIPTVALYADLGRWLAAVDGDGRFSFNELTPGNVELIAESAGGGRGQVAYARLPLDSDQDNIVLEPAPWPQVQFRCEGADGKPLREKDVILRLARTSPAEDPRTEQVECGVASAVGVGTWQLSVATPARFALSGVRIQQRPSASNEISLLPGQTVEISAALSGKGAAFKGRLLGAGGAPATGAMVFLSPLDRDVARIFFGKGTARAGLNGEFVMEGLPPGRYKVSGSFDALTAEEIDWSDPSLLTVDLEEGASLAADVRLPS